VSRRNQHDDFTYNRLEELAKVQGKATIPPRLGNLVKCLPEWRQVQKKRDQERSEKEQAADHVPGTGRITNWTQQRLKGEAPPLVYTRMETSAARSWPPRGGWSRITFGDLGNVISQRESIPQDVRDPDRPVARCTFATMRARSDVN
jgi:hypothetical protein